MYLCRFQGCLGDVKKTLANRATPTRQGDGWQRRWAWPKAPTPYSPLRKLHYATGSRSSSSSKFYARDTEKTLVN